MLSDTTIIQLYIDPATGSMLFSVLLGVFITAGFFLRMLLIRIKTAIGGKTSLTTQGHHKYLIYSDDKRYWNTFKPVLDEFENRKIDVVFWTSSEDDPVFSTEYKYVHSEFIGKGNKSFVKLNAANADVFLSTTPDLDVLQWKRSKGVGKYVHIFHAATSSLTYRMFGLDFYDVVLAASDFQIAEMRVVEKKRRLSEKEAKVVGLPYFDYLSDRLSHSKKTNNDNRVILLAPSWGKSGFLYRFGDKLIDNLLDTGYEIVFRPHPQSYTADKEMLARIHAKYDKRENFSWNSDNDNFDILNKADLLISDFSGVVFDFSIIFGKPIMYTSVKNFDDSIYDSHWVKGELWKFKVLPTIGCEITEEDMAAIKEKIDSTIVSDKYEQGIKAAREHAWKNQGHSAETIVNYLAELQSRICIVPEAE